MDVYQQDFEKKSEETIYWLNKAADLYAAARILSKAMENKANFMVWDSYKMLMGMSIELLLKAHCIKDQKDFLPSHNLVKLSASANMTLTKEEENTLILLTEYVIWDGRYPVPKNSDFHKEHWLNQSKFEYDSKEIGGLVFEQPNNLLDLDKLTKIWRKFSEGLID